MSEITGIEPARTNRARIAREIALTLGAVIGLVCILVAAAALLLGITPLIVRSGSMEPTIPTGALAIAKDLPANDIKPGDVISVDNQQGIRITHRVVSVDSVSGDAAAVTLKGDANGVPDAQPYVITSAKRVAFHVDGLGYAIAWLNTPAAMAVGALIVAALVWITIFPTGRRRSPGKEDTGKPKHAAGVAPSLVLIAMTVTAMIGIGHVHGTAAVYTSSATATTGSFASRADFVPRINTHVVGLSYTTCATSGPTNARVVTLNWKHIGPPYQYRIILRDLQGNVWRTIDVVPPAGSVAGSTVSATFGATGFPDRAVQWDYDAEIHTMLPGGAVSPDWRGERVYQDSLSINRENLTCRLIATSGTGSYVSPPASINCVTNAVPKTATVSWPHVATGYTYRLIVRNPTTGNIAYTTSVSATGTPVGQPVSSTIAYNNLTAGILTGTAATVEIRSQAIDASQSTGFVSYQLTVTSSSTTVACAAAGPSALRVAPTTTTPPPSTTSTTAAPAESTTTTTPPSTTSPSGTSTSTTSAAPTTTTTVPTTPAEQPLSQASDSTSGNYSAQLMQTATGPVVLIRDASGVEAYRTSAAADDTLQWVTGSDELRITGSSGAWTISRTTGDWTKTPYVDAPATTSATTSP